MLAGVAEAIDLDAEQLDDIRTAVTEACNNAVLHAYEGSEGPLEVDIRLPPRSASRSSCETRESASTSRAPDAGDAGQQMDASAGGIVSPARRA